MFGFLQGFSYGLFLSCLPWFVIGMIDPRVAVPTEPPTRWRAILRYWIGVPFVAFALWLTSLWGGFSPSFTGWLCGLGALVVSIPVERWWHRQTRQQLAARRRAMAQQDDASSPASPRGPAAAERHEAGVTPLDPARPPAGADRVVIALCKAKQGLLDAAQADLATQADRLNARYARVLAVLSQKFDAREVTYDRSRAMVADIVLAAADNLSAMAAMASGVAGIDADYVRRRLAEPGASRSGETRDALQHRLDLVADTHRRLAELSAHNETAMTTLDDAIVVLSRIDTDRPQAATRADEALADLKRFLNRAERYGQQV